MADSAKKTSPKKINWKLIIPAIALTLWMLFVINSIGWRLINRELNASEIDFSDDGSLLLTKIKVNVWNWKENRYLRSFREGPFNSTIYSMSIGKGNRYCVYSDSFEAIHLYDLEQKKEITTLPYGEFTFMPDGKRILTAQPSDRSNCIKLVLFDMEKEKVILEREQLNNDFSSSKFFLDFYKVGWIKNDKGKTFCISYSRRPKYDSNDFTVTEEDITDWSKFLLKLNKKSDQDVEILYASLTEEETGFLESLKQQDLDIDSKAEIIKILNRIITGTGFNEKLKNKGFMEKAKYPDKNDFLNRKALDSIFSDSLAPCHSTVVSLRNPQTLEVIRRFHFGSEKRDSDVRATNRKLYFIGLEGNFRNRSWEVFRVDLKSGSMEKTKDKQSGYDYYMALSPDGRYLAQRTGGYYDGRYTGSSFKIWDFREKKYIRTITPNTGVKLEDIKFSPDGKYIAASSVSHFGIPGKINGKIKIFDVKNGKLVRELKVPKFSIFIQ